MTKAKKQGEKRARGRPSLFTHKLADEVCRRIADGESLRAICEGDEMPAEATVRAWAIDNVEGFSAQYARSCQLRAERWAEEIVGIADDGRNDTYLDDDGNERTNSDVIARSRLRVDTRKWLLSKVLPKVYGEKVEHEHSGKLTLESLVLGSVAKEER